jgi:hypothetical protein
MNVQTSVATDAEAYLRLAEQGIECVFANPGADCAPIVRGSLPAR